MSDEADQRLWINGKWVSLNMSRLSEFIHDLPILPPPFDEDLQTEWLSYFSYGEQGGSAWTHTLRMSMLQVKVAAYASGATIVESHQRNEASLQDAAAMFRSDIRSIDLFLESVQGSFVACWADQPDEIERIYQDKAAIDLVAALPHLQWEKDRVDGKIRQLVKDVNRHEAEFNKWLKGKTRTEMARNQGM